MTDRHAMPYMMYDECVGLGLEPYAVYGGKVYSFKTSEGATHPHGSVAYGRALQDVEAHHLMRAAALAGARGC